MSRFPLTIELKQTKCLMLNLKSLIFISKYVVTNSETMIATLHGRCKRYHTLNYFKCDCSTSSGRTFCFYNEEILWQSNSVMLWLADLSSHPDLDFITELANSEGPEVHQLHTDYPVHASSPGIYRSPLHPNINMLQEQLSSVAQNISSQQEQFLFSFLWIDCLK